MKILIVATFVPPHIGGLEVVVQQQARTLADMGNEVTVFTSRHDRRLADDETIDGYRVLRTGVWNAIERRTAVPYPVWGFRSLARLIGLVREADVVHVHDVYYQPTVMAAFLAHRARRPLFITQHVAIVQHDSWAVMAVQRLIYGTIGARLWRWSRGIIAYNVLVQRFLVERGVPEEKIQLVYNGIDTNVFRPGDPSVRKLVRDQFGLPQDKPLVLFVGRLVPKKGYRELIAAHHPDYEIVLAGPGPVPADLPSGVTLVGPIDRGDVLRLYQASDLFAHPACGEMFTLAMQEAMACGLPVVATADSAYDEYGLDTAALALVPTQPEILTKTFLAILGDDEQRALMGAYSRQLAVSRFDWRRNTGDLSELYCQSDRHRSSNGQPRCPVGSRVGLSGADEDAR
jgi:glycosyltransferase involved in cell wall biosynthesis